MQAYRAGELEPHCYLLISCAGQFPVYLGTLWGTRCVHQ